MKLQSKLLSAFGLSAAVTLTVLVLGVWQVHRLSSALYEIGVVRLPSIQGLAMMREAMADLDLSARRLLSMADKTDATQELERQARDWRSFEAGWVLYEPLPQTEYETKLWRGYVPAAQAWRRKYTDTVAALASKIEKDDRSGIAAARQSLVELMETDYAHSAALLADLTSLNYQVADETRQRSISSRRDVERIGAFVPLLALVGIVGTFGFGLIVLWRLSRPVAAVADALDRVAEGDLNAHVEHNSSDEIGQMVRATNHLVETLRTSDARLRLISDNLPESMLYEVVRENGGTMKFLYLSAGIERLHGLTAEMVLRDSALLYEQILEEDRPTVAAAEAASLASMSVCTMTVRIRKADGSIRWMSIASQPRRMRDGRVAWDGIEIDVTDQRRHEEELRRTNRALRALSQCNQALVHTTDERVLLQQVCDIIVEQAGYRLAWVGYAEHDENKLVRLVAHAGAATEYLSGLNISWDDVPRGRGPTGTAIRTGQSAICRNFLVDAQVAPWREQALRHGLQSSLVFPLRRDGGVFGALTIYSVETDAFDKGEFNLLAELAEDLAYGLNSLRIKSALQASEDRYRDAMYNSAIGMALVGLDGRWLEVNPALCQILGYTRSEMLARGFQAITHPEDLSSNLTGLQDLLEGESTTYEAEKRYLHKSGHVVWAQLSVALLHDSAGKPLHFVSQIQDITVRKQVEIERERLARAIDAHHDGAYWMDSRNRIIYVNDAGCRRLGYTREELLGSHVEKIAPRVSVASLEAVWLRLREKGSFSAESVHRKKDGTLLPVEISATYVRVGGEEINCGFAHDITERLRTEAILRESEEKFSTVFRAAPVMIIITDLATGAILDVNEEGLSIMGFRRDEVIGRSTIEVGWIAEGSRKRLIEALQTQGRVTGWASSFQRRDGRTIHGLVNCDRLEFGGRDCLLVVMADITARKVAEDSLETAAERLALALRASQFGVWRHNLQTRVTEWDARMFAIFGLPESSVIPSLEEILEFVAAEDRPMVRQSWNAMPTCNRSYYMRFRAVRPDGKIRHIKLQGQVHDDGIGRPEWAIGVAGDVTEIVEATAESERLRAQLQQSQKMEALGTLAAGVAHDFNNLLTGINGFVDLASTTLGPEHEASGLLQQARRGAMSARDLVRRILNFSRTNKDNPRARLNVVELVRDTAPLIAAALPGNISLTMAMECDVAPVLADSSQLQQILMNLCTNGAHAIGRKSGEVQIGVRLEELGQNGGKALPKGCVAGRYVRLAVRDNGSGMSPETLDKIFEPFFTTKKQGEGTGLGLSIVRDIVAAHEGGIAVDSVLGSGTTFMIFLPIAKIIPDSSAPEMALARGRGTGQRVMIVDDEPSVAVVTRLMLGKNGYESEMFNSSVKAWKRFETHPKRFDLLIVDQNMPEMSGTEFVSRVRAVAPSLPIIMMSGRFENMALSSMRTAQLKKPFEIAELLESVRATLAHPAPPSP